MLRPLVREALDAIQSEQRRELLGAAGLARPADVPVVVNTDEALGIDADAFLHYRGLTFRVPPLSGKTGLALQSLQLRFFAIAQLPPGAATTATAEHLACIFEDGLAIMHRLVRPVARWRRLLWRWLPNPFRHATEEEFVTLLDFFSKRRTQHRGSVQRIVPMPRFRRSRSIT